MLAKSQWRRTVGFLAVAETIVWAGAFYLFPALLSFWESDLGWSIADLTGAFTLSLIISAIVAPVSGRFIDRGYGRTILAVCTLLAGLLVVLLSQVTELWQFYFIWALLGIVMAGALYEPCFAFLTHLLGSEARRAITQVTLVAGFAGTVSFPTAHVLAGALGWRGCVIVFGALICFVSAPLMWFSQSKNISTTRPSVAKKHDPAVVKQLLRKPIFWFLAGAFAIVSLNHVMLITHLLPLLHGRGVHPDTAVLAASLIGPMQVVGRVVMMLVERHISITGVCMFSFLFLILAAVALYSSGSVPLLIFVFVLLQGSGYGVTSITRPVITAEYLGRANFGIISGLLAMPFMFASAIAPVIGAFFWALGGYNLVIAASIVAVILGLVLFLSATRLHSRQ